MLHQTTLPPVTQHHLLRAHAIIAPTGISFAAAMQRPECDTLRRVIEVKAALLRTEEWKATQARTVVPVRRVRLGVDGHPMAWCTQMASGPYAPILQPELPNMSPNTP